MSKEARILKLLFLLGWGTNLFSQQLSHQVLVPVAGAITAGGISYSQTIGETAVQIIGESDFIFTQGFQQPSVIPEKGNFPNGNGAEVFPNPVVDKLTVKLFGDVSRDFIIEIVNIAGTIVITERLSFIDKFYLEKEIPVNQLYKGLYFVRVISSDKLIYRIFKIEKL